MSTCCQLLPPSKLVAPPIPLNNPPIQVAMRFFGLAGFAAMDVSFSAPFDPHVANWSGSERSTSGPNPKAFDWAGTHSSAATIMDTNTDATTPARLKQNLFSAP